MSGETFFAGARWLLSRALVVLLVALAAAVLLRQFTGGDGVSGPISGRDHWHAAYEVFVCGQRQPNFPFWPGGVHTHDDGIIHIHPFFPREEREGAGLENWFAYGGGILTQTEMRMPGTSETIHNGDPCPDGRAGVLQVMVNGQALQDWSEYIPQHGDRIRIEFGAAAGD